MRLFKRKKPGNEKTEKKKKAIEASTKEKRTPSVESPLKALKNEDWEVRREAIQALGEIGDEKAIEPLIHLAAEYKREEEMNVRQGFVAETSRRRTVIESLVQIRHPEVTEFLISNIDAGSTLISYIIIDALGKRGDPKAVDPLIQTMKNYTHGEIRGYAAQALGSFGYKRVVEALKEAVEDPEIAVQEAAKKALENIGDNITVLNEEFHKDKQQKVKQKSQIYENKFAAECLNPQFVEETEKRNISNTAGIGIIADFGNSGKFKETIQKAEEFLQDYSDFDYLYYWMGIAYKGLKDYSSAQSILKEGLEKAKSKSYLCLKIGEVAKESQNAQQALKWWCHSIHCHESNPHDLDNTPYLYLAAIAGAYGLQKEHDNFQSKALSIKNASLSFDAISDIQSLFTDQKTEAMSDVVKEMSKLYF